MMKLYSILPIIGCLLLTLTCTKKNSQLNNADGDSTSNEESKHYNDSVLYMILNRNTNDKLILDFYAGMNKDEYQLLLEYYYKSMQLTNEHRESTCNLRYSVKSHLCSGFQTVRLVVDNKIINIRGSLSGYFNNLNQLDSIIFYFDFPYAYPDQWLNIENTEDLTIISPIIDVQHTINSLLALYRSKYGPYNSTIKTKGGNPQSYYNIYKWKKNDIIIRYSDITTPKYDLKDILKSTEEKNFTPEETGSSKSVSITYTTSSIIKIGDNENSNKRKEWEQKIKTIKEDSKKDI